MSSVSAERVAGLDHGDPDGRVGDGVEGQPGLLVGEGHRGQRRAVDGPVGGHDPRPEAVDQRLVGRAARAPPRRGPPGRRRSARRPGPPAGRPRPTCPSRCPPVRPTASISAAASRRGRRATANRTSVVSSSSSVTNQSSAVMPVSRPASPRADQLVGEGQQPGVRPHVPRVGDAVAQVEDVEAEQLVRPWPAGPRSPPSRAAPRRRRPARRRRSAARAWRAARARSNRWRWKGFSKSAGLLGVRTQTAPSSARTRASSATCGSGSVKCSIRWDEQTPSKLAAREAQPQRVHLGDPQAVGPVAGGGRRHGVRGVVDAHDLAVGGQEAGRLEALAAPHVEDAPVPMRSRTAR